MRCLGTKWPESPPFVMAGKTSWGALTAEQKAAATTLGFSLSLWCGHPPRHGLSSGTMALITSDYGILCSLRIKWP